MVDNFNLNENILFEDDWVVIIDKPSGLIVNRSKTAKEKTLQDFLDEKYTFDGDEVFVNRSGTVHRLDKDTSGVLIVAKQEDAFAQLQKHFKKRKVKKEYTAIVHGGLENEIIEIDAPIGRSPVNFIKFAIVVDGKESFTKATKILEKEKHDETLSKVKIEPKTGRTHQIRVHFASINHPVVGDRLYCPKRLYEKDLQNFGRLMLHSNKITIYHPESNEQVTFESKIPSIFNI